MNPNEAKNPDQAARSNPQPNQGQQRQEQQNRPQKYPQEQQQQRSPAPGGQSNQPQSGGQSQSGAAQRKNALDNPSQGQEEEQEHSGQGSE